MRDYDEKRLSNGDLSFRLRGETLHLKRVRPEVLDEILAIENEFLAIDTPGYGDVIHTNEAKLLLLLADEDQDTWKRLRENVDDPVEYREINDLSQWAFEVVTGFPTRLVAPSGIGGGATEASSEGG
jgi:hypothetical protein